jgi:hypothetical protein
MPELKYPDVLYVDETFTFYWYKSNNTHERIGCIDSEYTSYIFLNDRFFGKVYAITGNDNINKVLRFFTDELEALYKDDPKNSVLKNPLHRKDGSWLFVIPGKIVIIRRYSLHLARVEILCKELWEKRKGITDKMIDNYKEKYNKRLQKDAQ